MYVMPAEVEFPSVSLCITDKRNERNPAVFITHTITQQELNTLVKHCVTLMETSGKDSYFIRSVYDTFSAFKPNDVVEARLHFIRDSRTEYYDTYIREYTNSTKPEATGFDLCGYLGINYAKFTLTLTQTCSNASTKQKIVIEGKQVKEGDCELTFSVDKAEKPLDLTGLYLGEDWEKYFEHEIDWIWMNHSKGIERIVSPEHSDYVCYSLK